jgi:hypothetical protein
VRGELSVRIDRRSTRHRFQSAAVPSTGFAGQAYGGWQQGIADDPARFGYGGLDVIHHIDLFGGDRVLAIRGAIEGTLGDRDMIPFVDLPSLGGPSLLRGYPAGRFRDSWAAVASLEYTYPITESLAGFVFTDAGRVAAEIKAIPGELPRASIGFGVQLQNRRTMRARVWVAATDEGVFTSFVLEPTFSVRGREVR